MFTLGTASTPLRVAIIGSGPSGFYAAEHLQKQKNLVIEIDMFDRLPTPYGLVRGGVAPDHDKIKSVTKVYDKIASHPNLRFYGNVEFGKDLTHDDLAAHYHAVIYAVGAQTDKRLDIPGEDLPGSYPATEFVAWYNGHPDFRDYQFDLSQETAVVIGVGNVAMDVVRILARTPEELRETDIADYALDALANSRVKTIYLMGRRGPAQAAFTNPEIKEFGELADADVIISPEDASLDPLSREYVETSKDRTAQKNIETLTQYSQRPPSGKARRIIIRFLVSPTEITGNGHVEAIKIAKNVLVKRDDGSLSAKATDQTEVIPAGLVFRSVGYRGVALPGVPFYDKWGTIPNDHGRVLTAIKDGQQVIGDYVVGWIKRGPSGVIGTNKPDSVETVTMLLEDVAAGKVFTPAQPSRSTIEALLSVRKPNYVTFEDWQALDRMEQERGAAQGRPRLKFTRVEDMLNALEQRHPEEALRPAGD
jgi:ferredoxin--NADP+ reductase